MKSRRKLVEGIFGIAFVNRSVSLLQKDSVLPHSQGVFTMARVVHLDRLFSGGHDWLISFSVARPWLSIVNRSLTRSNSPQNWVLAIGAIGAATGGRNWCHS